MQRVRSGIHSVISFLLISSVAPAAWSAEAYTIEGAVNAALSKNTTVLNAREKLRELDAVVKATWATVFPTLSANAAIMYRKDALNIGNPLFGGEPYNMYNVGLSIAQPVYHGGALTSSILAAKKEESLRKLDIEIAERDLSVQVIQSFYSLLLAESRVHTLLDQQEVLKELLRTAESRYARGLSQRLEVLQVRTQNALLVPQVASAQNDVQTTAANVASLLGLTDAPAIQVKGSLDGVTIPLLKKILEGGAGRIPELERNALSQEQLEDKKDVQLARHFPSVDLTGNWGRQAFVKSDLLDSYSTAWNLGLQVQIPLFSGLSSFAERRGFASQAAQLDIDRNRIRDQFSLNQVNARKQVELALTQIETSKKALDLATDAHNEARTTYNLGRTTYTQLFDAETKFVDAMFAYDKARYDAIVAASKYFQAVGRPLQDLLKVLEGRAET